VVIRASYRVVITKDEDEMFADNFYSNTGFLPFRLQDENMRISGLRMWLACGELEDIHVDRM